MLVHYFFSYLGVVSITFVITLAGFMGLGVRYTLLLSFLAALFDMLPILGMAMIYIPVAIVFFLTGNYFVGVAVLVLYVIAMVVRQIVEPKIVSTSLGVHPVAIIAALFIGLMANGILGMIFCVFLVIFYNVLNKAGVL
jgi:predicted PurR-regulated permease PerM